MTFIEAHEWMKKIDAQHPILVSITGRPDDVWLLEGCRSYHHSYKPRGLFLFDCVNMETKTRRSFPYEDVEKIEYMEV